MVPIILLISGILLGAFPAEARNRRTLERVWDGTKWIWRRIKPVKTGIVVVIGGYGLTNEGYKMYQDCMRGRKIAIQRGEFPDDHSLAVRVCAGMAHRRQQ